MTNEILWLVMLLFNFGAILLAFRLWGRVGLLIFIPISAIIANIQVLKTVDLFGLEATLGNIVYAGGFLVTDILTENYGKKSAKIAVAIGFFSLIISTVFMYLAIQFIPSSQDWAQESLKTIFGFLPRVTIASLAAYLISQLHDIWAYDFWKKKAPHMKFIFLRNNLSTMVSQLIDTIVFTTIAFTSCFGLLKPVFEDNSIIISIFLTTYLMKWIVAALDTPFLYLATHWKQKGKIKEVFET
ncbi:MAG: queuosine precursor transporter [Alphaproteobacteria bacterium]